MLVPGITQAFGISALPSVTSAWMSGSRCELQESISSVLRMTALFSIPAGLGLSVLSGPARKHPFPLPRVHWQSWALQRFLHL